MTNAGVFIYLQVKSLNIQYLKGKQISHNIFFNVVNDFRMLHWAPKNDQYIDCGSTWYNEVLSMFW